jgi:hypothetical protein
MPETINKILSKLKTLIIAGSLVSHSFFTGHKTRKARKEALFLLNSFSREGGVNAGVDQLGKVLVDGMWDNANYWIRYSVFRKSLGLHQADEVGLLGKYSRKQVKDAFSVFGINNIIDIGAGSPEERYLIAAKLLLMAVISENDILKLKMPYDFPAQIVYDGILKRQRRAFIDIDDKLLPLYLGECLRNLDLAYKIFDHHSFNMVVLSHALDFTYGAIAWMALQKKISVIVLYGDFGHAKFFHLQNQGDMFRFPGRPNKSDSLRVSDAQTKSLQIKGREQLDARMMGQTDDVGALYAYSKRKGEIDRRQIAQFFGWDSKKPIVGVYNSNWFDFPHGSGLNYFRDFYDWIMSTLEVAKEVQDVNWLFKAHPCDQWYAKINGQRLEDLIEATNLPHIKLANNNWNGFKLMSSLDGVITCHGSIGIEATAHSIPVLVPYEGWYGAAQFVKCAISRADYLSTLKGSWWKDINLVENKIKAEIFAGWIYCVPDWHGEYKYLDDSMQDQIFISLRKFIKLNNASLLREVSLLRDWYIDGHPYYHVYKISKGSNFQLGNIAQ